MKALVTGAAGFVGSHLAERLGRDGHAVRAVDCVTDYYDVEQKRSNLEALARSVDCEVVFEDLCTCDLGPLLAGVDVVFHQAGQPGVRASWSSEFDSYIERNILVTQRLLEAARGAGIRRFVFASSSSIYGNSIVYPTTENDLPRPYSPYGVTKLAAEHLCGVYAHNWGLPTVSLRYFTVYGPRQRPDMAMHRLIEAALSSEAFPMYGDGQQVRDFTYVGDVVEANLLAASAPLEPGLAINISGGSSVTLREIVDIVRDLAGPIEIDPRPPQAGDVRRTGGSTERASELLDWRPRVSLREGLAAQIKWQAARRGEGSKRGLAHSS